MTARSGLGCLLLTLVASTASAQTGFTNTVEFPTGITFDGTYYYLSHGSGYRELFKIDASTGVTV